MPAVLDADIEIDAAVVGRGVLGVGLKVELHVKVLVLLPELENLLRDVQANRFQLGLGGLVAFVAHQLLQRGACELQQSLRGFVGVRQLIRRYALL